MEEKDFEIEIQEEEEEKAQEVQLPLNFLTLGEVANDDVKVYIRQRVFKALEKFAATDTTKELGSILIGDYVEEQGKTHVIISDFIEAKYTDASSATLTFTHETWGYVHAKREKLYPDKKIIGWQHTHPNYGIFLSNYDMFIQENFFNMPFQVAYVIDPIQDTRGFFQWKNDKVEKLKGFFIYDEVGKPIRIEKKKPSKEKEEEKKETQTSQGINKTMKIILAVLCAVCVILTFSVISLKSDYNELLEQQENFSSTVSSIIGSQSSTINDQSKRIADLEKKLGENSVQFVTHTVKSGESLYSICQSNKIDYSKNIKTILALNGIENENKIFVGQQIILPVSQ